MSTAKDQTASPRRLHNFTFPITWASSKRAPRLNKPPPLSSTAAAASSELPTPWNLRTRRSSCDSPASAADQNPNETKKTEFSVSLSAEEIEEDFVRLKGRKPYRRPRKRPRNIQKKLDALFPGLWLEDVTADSYKTND